MDITRLGIYQFNNTNNSLECLAQPEALSMEDIRSYFSYWFIVKGYNII